MYGYQREKLVGMASMVWRNLPFTSSIRGCRFKQLKVRDAIHPVSLTSLVTSIDNSWQVTRSMMMMSAGAMSPTEKGIGIHSLWGPSLPKYLPVDFCSEWRVHWNQDERWAPISVDRSKRCWGGRSEEWTIPFRYRTDMTSVFNLVQVDRALDLAAAAAEVNDALCLHADAWCQLTERTSYDQIVIDYLSTIERNA